MTQWQYFRVQRATQIEYAHSTNSPQHFLDLSNNSGDNEGIDDCHRQTPAVKPHLCKAEQEEGPFSNQLTQSCIATVDQAAAAAAGCHWVYQASERLRECLLRQ